MKNKIILNGIIKNIEYSHTISNVEYYKANLIVKRETGKEDIINLKFKRFACKYNENDNITLVGNIRTFTSKIDGKNKVEVYVFTYFDMPEEKESEEEDVLTNIDEGKENKVVNNIVELEGRICKKNGLNKTLLGKDVIDFILANNMVRENQSINCYIPCVAWGQNAKLIEEMPIGSELKLNGELRSREYKKKLDDDDDFEIRVAHEVNISSIDK